MINEEKIKEIEKTFALVEKHKDAAKRLSKAKSRAGDCEEEIKKIEAELALPTYFKLTDKKIEITQLR